MANILLNFTNDISQRDANMLAQELEEYLRAHATSDVAIKKDKDNTMDFGATLAIVLGSGSVIAIGKGIADWLRKRSEVKITIKTPNGEVIGENLTSKDIPVILGSLEKLATNNAN